MDAKNCYSKSRNNLELLVLRVRIELPIRELLVIFPDCLIEKSGLMKNKFEVQLCPLNTYEENNIDQCLRLRPKPYPPPLTTRPLLKISVLLFCSGPRTFFMNLFLSETGIFLSFNLSCSEEYSL